jgi:protoporphyrin/coproporphyrin ferrochelatase
VRSLYFGHAGCVGGQCGSVVYAYGWLMTAREFLNLYRYDDRLPGGGFYPPDPVDVEPGDVVGVVMVNHGGPAAPEEVEPFLYNLLMDPALLDLPLPHGLRDWICRTLAHRRAQAVAECYRQIGGSPIHRLCREQAQALETRLNDPFGALTGARFRTYVAMRYWHPTCEAAAAEMTADGVTKVVHLPLYPHYSKSTTGSALAYWSALEAADEIPAWPCSLVSEYATHPLYVQALSDRIDEALQRFPRGVRERVPLVFSAHGTPVRESRQGRDPYCALVQATVQAVTDLRGQKEKRPFRVVFARKVGPKEWLSPAPPPELVELAREGATAVLMVPVGSVTDHIETAFALDIRVREEAVDLGIEHFEVTSGLNCHPLFIEALAESVAAQVDVPLTGSGDGVAELSSLPAPGPPSMETTVRRSGPPKPAA